MAKMTNAGSRPLYSWWWDSHISPKNSKWLKENLTDMDIKVKTMIKLLEEDADSFARRAEMYYKKRPELLKLVEEFYRAYRALAERYDHATGALRQAQKTMAVAFPNQIPLVLTEESPSGSSITEAALHNSEIPPEIRAMLDSDNSHGAYHGENDAIVTKKGLKQWNGMFDGEEATHAKSAEGRVKKSLNFQDEGINSESKELSQLSKENQNLKIQITSESKRADNIQAEVQSLQETISKLNSEKESVLLKHQLSLERISNMETEISRCQEKFKKHDDQMLMVDSKLKGAEERRLLLDKANQSLQLELDALKRRSKDQQEELNSKQEELEKLNNLIQEKHLQVVQAETARISLENLQSKSQEEARLLVLEVQSGLQKLKKMELDKVGLEEEIQKLKDENGCLNEQILASAFKIISLQDEIILLKDLKSKLEDEVGLNVEEKKVLQQEISCLKEDRNNLEHRHQQLTEEIKAVNFHVESLWAMVKELQNGNSELKQICKKHEDEKVVHFENLKHLEKISEQNVVLENSLSDANVEVESSREKIKTLEDSYESLNDMMSIHLSQKALLLAQAESDTEEMEKLFERNTVLENSMADVNVELESLRIKMNALEESCRSLYDQNSSLLSEKGTMIDQVERTIQSLESLEDKYAELESKHLNLEREKDSLLHRIMDLQDSLTREKGEYETLIMSIFLSSKSQLSALENEISLLQENGQLREEEFEVEQHKILDAQIENFILQQCLFDMSEKYSILSVQCQKYLEVSKHAEKSMTEVKEELLVQVKKLTSSTIRIGKLREGIQLMLTELFINREYGSLDDTKDELLLQLTFREIRNLMNFVSDAQDENQLLLLDKSVIITILNQFGLDVINLKAEKFALEQQCEIKNKEFSGLQNAELKLLEMNEQLRHDAEAGNQRHEALKGETEVVRKNLVDLQESQITLQSEVFKLLEENQSLSEKLSHSRDKADYLEEVNSIILAKVLAMEYLYLIFRSSSAEKASEIQLLRNDLACLNGAKNDIEQEIKLMNETLVAIEAENVHLKETVANLEDCNQRLRILEDDLSTTRYVIEQLNVEIESGKDLAARKDIELLQANHRFLSIQDKNIELNQNLEDVQLAFDGAMVVREESEGKIFKLSEDNAERENQIVCLRQENGILTTELSKLHLEIESLKTREDHLNFDLRKEADEVKCCEVEIASLLDDIHVTTVTAAVFEEKALELLIACDISAIVQRERLCEEIAIKKSNVNELKKKLASMDGENISLKEETSAYLLLMTALRDDLSHLEEHTLLLANHRASNHPEKQNLTTSLEHCKSIQEPSEYLIASMPAGVQELQKLRAKVKELQKAVADTGSLLKREMAESDASLEAAMKEIEVLRSKENFKVKDEQMTKDIQLDLVLSSSQYGIDVGSRRSSTTEEASASDQLLAWETINKGTNKVHYAFEAVEKEKNKYPSSKLVHEKELSIDKLELPNRVKDNHQGLNVEPIEVLSSNALRLSLLQTSVQELKKDLSEMSLEIDKVKPQLKEAEGAIMHLIDTNTKLAKKAEDFTSKSGSLVGKWNEKRNSSRRRISEHAVRGSEKIEKLESELQKIQFMLLKLKEDRESRGAEALERRRVLLKDYLYGKHNSRGKKKSSACGCMKPRTKDD